jgi:hypothetical protein
MKKIYEKYMEKIEINKTSDLEKYKMIVEELFEQEKHLFIFFFLDKCGPCEATKPEWEKIESGDKNSVSLLINQEFKSDVLDENGLLQFKMKGFPYIVYIHKNGENAIIEPYEGERDSNDFNKWIESKSSLKGGRRRNKSKKSRRRKRKSKKRYNRKTIRRIR